MAITVKCENCDRQFAKYPSRKKRRKRDFCSKGCYWKWLKGKHTNTGKTHFKTGRIPEKPFQKGMTPWNKGKNHLAVTGSKNPNWNGGITTKNRLERIKFREQVQKLVLERDDYTCQMCGEKGGKLQVDHIQSWKDYVDLRFDINNCRTLCMRCHYKITFGKNMPKNIKSWGHNLKEKYL